jgi:hypothetical protein
MALPGGARFALVQELGRRQWHFARRREDEGDSRPAGVGSGFGIGERQKKALFHPVRRKLKRVIGGGARTFVRSLPPEEETAGFGKPVPVYDDHQEGSGNPLDAPAKPPSLGCFRWRASSPGDIVPE